MLLFFLSPCFPDTLKNMDICWKPHLQMMSENTYKSGLSGIWMEAHRIFLKMDFGPTWLINTVVVEVLTKVLLFYADYTNFCYWCQETQHINDI